MVETIPQKYRIALKFSSLYYPFTYPEILNSLGKREYAILVPPQPIKSGARIYISGHVATKLGCFIELNEAKRIIACESDKADSVISSLNEVIDLVRVDFNLDLAEELDYCELSGAVVASDGDPTNVIRRFSNDNYRIFDEALGADTACGSIRIIPKNGAQTDRKWFDITISEKVPSANKSYYVEFVFRNGNDVESVANFTSRLDGIIRAIIEKVGGE